MSSLYTMPLDTPFCLLDCQSAFANLTDNEKRYAHFLSQACWYGGLIVLHQTSPESPLIYVLLQKLFRGQSLESLKSTALKHGSSENDVKALMVYAGAFYSNMGNYKSFGDTKFVPDLTEERLWKILEASSCYESEPDTIKSLWESCSKQLYSLTDKERQLGLGGKGISTYFSYNCTNDDADLAQKFLDEKNISTYNTRLFKSTCDNGDVVYEVRLASVDVEGDVSPCGSYDYEGKKFNVTRGDHHRLLQHVVHNLNKAKEYAANEHETKMLENYIDSFTTGSIQKHKDGSLHWIRDKGPIVESYIGFIESYRDPYGTRGEFEGFVSMVNKVMSAKFATLVSSAEKLLLELPWPAEYEKDVFLKPDFTSLDVLTFGGSGIPAGINIPNYDDIRQTDGFKNVSLGNVLSSHSNDQTITFLGDADKELYSKLKAPSFEVQVGLHELLGHGSGKLFIRDDEGQLNFNVDSVKHLITGTQISSWYTSQETWDSKFSTISASYEECRAECVGLYLCLNKDILRIFGHEGDEADDILYVNWLNMCRAGVMGLEFYTPENDQWRQAHMQARYVILRVLCEAGEGLITLQQTTGADGQPDVTVILDRSKINTVGKKAIGEFLRKLQVYKSTADVAGGSEMYLKYSAVDAYFTDLRNIVIARRLPRRIFVQSNTVLSDDGVSLLTYEANSEGMIKSFAERCTDPDINDIIQSQWSNDKHLFE